MLNSKDVILEEEECAEMLGISVDNYRNELRNIKAAAKENIEEENVTYDNSILKFFGISESDLKKKIFSFL